MPKPVWGVALFALAFVCRLLEWPRVFTAQGVTPPNGADEYYHLRRIWYSVVNFPELLERDWSVAFPIGGQVIWPPGFDLAVAALARALVGAEDQAAVERVAVFVPPILGGLAVVTAAAISSRVFSLRAGAVTGVLLALLPGHYVYSLLGMVDHHCAVSLFTALFVLGAVQVAQREPERSWWGRAVVLGLGAALFLSLWPGALLHLALLQGLAVIWMLQAASGQVATRRAWHLVLMQAVAAAAIAPLALGRVWTELGSFSPLVLTSFQPGWFAANALACALLARSWAAAPVVAASVRLRWLSAIAVAGVALVAALAAIPGLAGSLDTAAGWFRGDDETLERIIEMLPLFGDLDGDGPAWWGQRAERLLTRFIFLFPPLLALLAWRAARSGRADLWLLTVWASVSFAEALLQVRFVNSFSVAYTIVLGGTLVDLAGAARARLAGRPPALRLGAAVAGLVALLLILQPSMVFMAGIAEVWSTEGQGQVRHGYRSGLVYRAVARWLAGQTPVTRGYLDASLRPEYAVLARWDRGHLLRYMSERPVVQDNFAAYGGRYSFEMAAKFYSSEVESQAVRILDELRVRYVIADRMGAAQGERYAKRAMLRRLYPYPSREDPRQQAGLPLRFTGLRHLRLVLETTPGQLGVSNLRVFERVPGALLTGEVTPNTLVRAKLQVASGSRSEPGTYVTSVRSSSEGRYALRVPYATSSDGAIRTADAYRVVCGEGRGTTDSGEVAVPEQAVAFGETVSGPTLDCTSGARAAPL